jgi:hypothetical protein
MLVDVKELITKDGIVVSPCPARPPMGYEWKLVNNPYRTTSCNGFQITR